MSESAYSEINLHVTWHTKLSHPFITSRVENELFGFVKKRIFETDGAYFHGIGGTENHVHVVFSLEPELLISDFIGQLKGASAYFVNRRCGAKSLQWQRGYGVVSFGTENLPWVLKYVENQKEHHRVGNVHGRLERIVGKAR